MYEKVDVGKEGRNDKIPFVLPKHITEAMHPTP